MAKKTAVVVVLDEKSLEQIERIKGLIRKSALDIITVGEILNKAKARIEHNGGMTLFYEKIGMSGSTAGYYMRIARNEEIQALKKAGKLDGLNMAEILKAVDTRVNVRGPKSTGSKVEYIPLGYGKFDYAKCRSTNELKSEYKLLESTVEKLELELELYKTKTA